MPVALYELYLEPCTVQADMLHCSLVYKMQGNAEIEALSPACSSRQSVSVDQLTSMFISCTSETLGKARHVPERLSNLVA